MKVAQTPPPAGSRNKHPGSVQLTLADVCAILRQPLPKHLEHLAEKPFPGMAAATLASGSGDLFFVRPRRLKGTAIDVLVRKGIEVFVGRSRVVDSAGVEYPTLIVRAPEQAFVEVCRVIGESYSARKIALTGSIGKTTTKEMLRLVSEESFNTLYSRGNQNGPAQVGRYIQAQTPETEVYIQETGAGAPGLVRTDAEMLQPDAFVITNVGLNHVGAYGGRQENLVADKLSLDRFLPEDGVAFVNFDDPLLREAQIQHRVVSFSAVNPAADYYAKDIRAAEGRLSFRVVESDTGLVEDLELVAFGTHNVSNAVVAFAVGRWLGVPVDKIRTGLSKYRGEGLRQNLVTVGGQKILVDCYNASEGSAASLTEALATISPAPGGNRILVFGDIDDKLGDHTEAVHRRVGVGFAESESIDEFFLFGPHTKWVYEELVERGKKARHTEDRQELHRWLRDSLRPEDVVAFKGGQQMSLAITIDELYGTPLILLDGDVLKRRGREFKQDGLKYRRIREYGVQLVQIPKGYSAPSLTIPGEAEGDPVYLIGNSAGSRTAIEELIISDPVRTIASSAFFDCQKLRTVGLPSTLRFVGQSAFNSCKALKEVSIPEGTTTIGRRAFYACTGLRRITIPSSVTEIGEEALQKCPRVRVFGKAGSVAERYCKENRIRFSAR